ncbi:SMAD/FHA domain-containing protein [Dendryphion nanum]|uniref:SMAD/FHA domain-containing protein n=1 Tax=Dendryphion nanum TaxID=256645 RepID=A0A9P9EIS3_9PLEO|nr:SMAD/FHA domain-containing protein [Dendryphion nanum]
MPSSSASGRNASSAGRDLSPYSARRALTLGVNNNNNGDRPSNRERTRQKSSRSRSRIRSRSRDKNTKSHVQLEKQPEPKPRSVSKDASPMQIDPVPKEERKASPEPYRKPRERSRDRSRDRRRGTSHERRRDGSPERRRDRSRDRQHDGSREKRKDRHRDTSRDRSRDKRRHRDNSKDRRKDRSRDQRRDRRHSRSHSRDKKKRSHSKDHHRPRSRSPKRRRRTRSRSSSTSPKPHSRSSKPLPSQEISFRGLDNSTQPPTAYGGASAAQKPNFSTTGLLAKEANTVAGTKIALKYHEPPEARKPSPSHPWTLFIFSGADSLGKIDLGTQSCWMLGRAREVADIPLEHASASSQHAAIQFRYVKKVVEDEYGVRKEKGRVKPYVIDLESSNGTELNDEEIEKGRYVELRDGDILRFGACEREYVVMLPKE